MRLQCQFGQTMVLIVLVQGTELTLWTGAELKLFTKLFIINILRTIILRCLSCLNALQKPIYRFPPKVQVERIAGRAVEHPTNFLYIAPRPCYSGPYFRDAQVMCGGELATKSLALCSALRRRLGQGPESPVTNHKSPVTIVCEDQSEGRDV